ncbi:hypothetical protein Bca4012_093729 [Brassica carinata]|uniref:(rape) hypothetical protein n=1 Tax=Brassica napus TaxID=3708 RepID=A0A078H0C6_BRANA|nr:unnamed protein product [Brassica napus]CDY32130.1 BnaCnng06390D [Brassica napus]
MDVFDGLPDPILVDILDKSESLVLRLDHAVTTESQPDSPVSNFFKSLFKPFHGFFSLFPKPAKPTTTTIISPIIPSKILSRFDRIKNLDVERPGGDAKPEKSAGIKWKADFGKTLKTCVVVAFRSASTVSSSSDGELDAEFVTGLKTRVEWTINALMATSARHHLMSRASGRSRRTFTRDPIAHNVHPPLSRVVKEHKEMESLVMLLVMGLTHTQKLMHERGGEGTVVMKCEGLREFQEAARDLEVEERVERKTEECGPEREDEHETRAVS